MLTTFGVLTVGVLGGEASCSLFILTGVLQSDLFRMLVNDFLVARKISGFIIHVTVCYSIYGMLEDGWISIVLG